MYRYCIPVLAMWLCAMPAGAEIYKFVDDNGMVTYTNMPRPGVKPQIVIADPVRSPTPAAESGGKRKPSERTSSPGYFPKVDVSTQRKRDDMRRQLLEEERSSEQRSLSVARAALNAAGRQPGSALEKLLEAVRLHEKNIEMLDKELARLR